MIRVMEKRDITDCVMIWNRCIDLGEFVYERMDEDRFTRIFMENPHYTEEYCLVDAGENGKVNGFICGLVKREYLRKEDFYNTPGYITMLIVRNEARRCGVGAGLLAELENRFGVIGKKSCMMTYRNPVNLTWIIPGTDGHDHNNAPGVDMDTGGFSFFEKHGYQVNSVELGLYRDLSTFAYSNSYYEKIKRQSQEGIVVELYDEKRHYGFEELFDNLHGEVWRKTIQENMEKEHPLPVIVAACKDGRIVGFAGPIDRQESGRGWFNGIATHSEFERKGIAYVMFYRLLGEFKKIGAEYSSIFTDSGNPAYSLYQKAGFETARRWAVMEKPL